MADSYSGGLVPLYGVVIRDKCKTADHNTLKAYKTVAEDLITGASGPDVDDLKKAVAELDKVLAKK
jgi:hypothetical protein